MLYVKVFKSAKISEHFPQETLDFTVSKFHGDFEAFQSNRCEQSTLQLCSIIQVLGRISFQFTINFDQSSTVVIDILEKLVILLDSMNSPSENQITLYMCLNLDWNVFLVR